MLISGILLRINDWLGSFWFTMGVFLLFLIGIYFIFNFFFIQLKNWNSRSNYEKSISNISRFLIIVLFFVFPVFPSMISNPLYLFYVFIFFFFEGPNNVYLFFNGLVGILFIFSYYTIVHFLFIQSKGWKERNTYQKIITIIAITFMTFLILIDLKTVLSYINW